MCPAVQPTSESAPTPVEKALLAALSRPQAHAHHPQRVELRSTHISRVFLAGPWVYKVKRPVRYPFVDYSTLERRLHFCREELRLNRRLAPSVYLDVVPIVELGDATLVVADGRSIPDGSRIVEHAVKMRRLESERMLDRRVRAGLAAVREMEELGARIAAFHALCTPEAEAGAGGAERVRETLAQDLRETEDVAARTAHASDLETLRAFLERFVADQRALLDRRVTEGRVREGHGDLRAEHVCFEDTIQIVDCVEFSARLRTTDVASDLAFLTMDLDFLGAPVLAKALVDTYVRATGDDDLASLLGFYECQRALVRAKVESLRGREKPMDGPSAVAARARARLYFHLASRRAGEVPPVLVIVCGLQGTGKSTLARRLAEVSGSAVLSSDRIRKQLAGLPPKHDPRAPAWLYTSVMTDRTYGELLARAQSMLGERDGVILDATFSDPSERDRALALADRANVPLLFVECRSSEPEIERRLGKRAGHPDEVSDATIEVYRRERARFPPLDDVPESNRIVVDTTRGVEDAIETLRARVGFRLPSR